MLAAGLFRRGGGAGAGAAPLLGETQVGLVAVFQLVGDDVLSSHFR